MTANTAVSLDEQIKRLMAHLEHEQPQLLKVVQTFRELDKVAYQLGLLDPTESYATQVSWWPLVAVLGTFSSGKSTFINNVLGRRLQATGNQAVDDKFTVICYSPDSTPHVLPGLALDSDPRFPLYRISDEIDAELKGESQRLDTYLQLKTADSEALRGRIFIDSPGFDADEQRTATLRITNQIIDISDLVLVFFDARHPEPGAMRDTLEHLVSGTLERADRNKCLYILNQIDNAAREDNPEEVFAAWQRALAQKGLTAGRFYQIYDPASAIPIENEHVRRRFEAKREHDMAEILGRIRQLEVERSYRVTARLEQTAEAIREAIVPRVVAARRAWKRRVWWLDAAAFGGLAALALVLVTINGVWGDIGALADRLEANAVAGWLVVLAVVVAAWLLHRLMRNIAARSVLRQIESDASLGAHATRVARAFRRNARSWRPFFAAQPVGWSRGVRRRLDQVLSSAHAAVQELNDRYTDPSGRSQMSGQ
ncbi:MAG TPA: dynamin family protein, partial [Gammaproteobacteria bacterium]|nr:dynamin family protein [Gammaproteobacteria bacterium]